MCNIPIYSWELMKEKISISKRRKVIKVPEVFLIYSHTSWLESYIKIVWSGHGNSINWMQVLVRFFLAVKEGPVSMLGIRARRTEKTELSRPVFLYILNCLENAALNAGKHCPSTSNWRRRIRGLTLDHPGKSWLSKQTLTIFSVTSKRKEGNLKILDFVVLHTYPNASLVIWFCLPPFLSLPWKGKKEVLNNKK